MTMSLEDVFIELTADKEEKGYETITGLEKTDTRIPPAKEALSAADEKPAEGRMNGENPDVTEGARE